MADPALRRLTIEEFSAWQEKQPDLYELVGGRPQSMAGAKNVHDDIVVNILADLKNQPVARVAARSPETAPYGLGQIRSGVRMPDWIAEAVTLAPP